VQNLSVNIQPHQLDIDELNASMKGRPVSDRSADARLGDVNQRWTIMLQHIIDSKVRVSSHTEVFLHGYRHWRASMKGATLGIFGSGFLQTRRSVVDNKRMRLGH